MSGVKGIERGRTALRIARVVTFVVVAPFLGCGEVPGEPGSAGVEQVHSDIVGGTTITVDTVGSPIVNMSDPNMTGHLCSGTVIRNDWLLTAHHCVTQHDLTTGGLPILPSEVNVQILNSSNNPQGRLIVRHPTLDVALVKLTAAPIPQGQNNFAYENWIYLGNDSVFGGQSLFSQAWGDNQITSCSPLVSSGAGTLRWANMLISTLSPSLFFVVPSGANHVIPIPGDSGSALYYQVNGYERPVGVASTVDCTQNTSPFVTQAYYVRSDNFRGWFQGVAGWQPNVGTAVAFERSDGFNSTDYVDTNFHIKEIKYNATSGYHLTDLTATVGGQSVAQSSNISSYVRTDGVNAIVFKGSDTNVWEYSLNGSTWSRFNMTASLGLPGAVSSPSAYVRADNSSAVDYVGTNLHVYEMRLANGGSSWTATDLTAATGGPTPSQLGPIGYVRADAYNVVVYSASNGHVIELFDNGSGWSQGDLTALTGAPIAAGAARPYTREDTYSIVLFRDLNGHLWEMSLASGSFSWGANDLTAITGCPAASTDPSPYVRGDSWNAVAYAASNSHVYEMDLPPGGGWGCHDLTAASGAPATIAIPSGYVGVDRLTNVITVDSSRHVWDLSLVTNGANGWSRTDLTARAGGP